MSEYENSKPLDDQESKTTLTTNTPIVDAEPKGTTEQNHYRASEVITPDLDGGFFQYVNSVLRANFFLRFSLQDHYRNWLNIFFMLLVSIVVQLVGDFSHVGATGKVSLYGFPGVLFFIPISFVSAIVVSAFGRRLSKTLALLSLLCGICVLHQLMYLLLIFFYKVELLSTFLPRWHRSFDFFRYLWLALACGFAAMRVLDLDRNIKRLLLGLFTSVLIALPLMMVYRNPAIWIEDYEANDNDSAIEQYDALSREENFFAQTKLLSQELDQIQPSDAPQGQIFLVALAGYASQDVFMKEVLHVDELFLNRFDTEHHRVRLINNTATVKQFPIASTTGLQLALERVGKVMRADRDVLFLYLSSHGSKTHEISLDFGSMQFKSLNPKVLDQLLTKAGIKNRVIVVSACYSGGYIDVLKNEDSLIITSAAKDKTSFGCSNDADYTYFGKAFFVDALRENRSFVEAFELAKPAISQREKDEDYTPSEPQIFIGARIRPLIDSIVKQSNSASVKLGGSVYEHVNQAFVSKKDQEKRIQLARELVVLFENDVALDQFAKLCKEQQMQNTAEAVLAGNPDYFGGLTQRSPFRLQVVKAFQNFQETTCTDLDNAQYTEIFTEVFAQAHSEQELQNLIKFYSSALGKKSIGTNTFANIEAQKLALKVSSDINERASLQFSQTVGALVARAQNKK